MKNNIKFKYIVCRYEQSRNCEGHSIHFLSEVTGFSAEAEAQSVAYYNQLAEDGSIDNSCVFYYDTEDYDAVPHKVSTLFNKAKPFRLEQLR